MSKFKLTQNYKPVPVQPGPDIGQIQVQKWKNQTSNSSKFKFVHQPIHPKKHELLRPQSWFDPTKSILSNIQCDPHGFLQK